MRISDWSSDVCSSDLGLELGEPEGDPDAADQPDDQHATEQQHAVGRGRRGRARRRIDDVEFDRVGLRLHLAAKLHVLAIGENLRSEEHTSELQSLMRISYAVFCLKKKKNKNQNTSMTNENTTH